jgi:hypothetical protein
MYIAVRVAVTVERGNGGKGEDEWNAEDGDG